MRQKKTYDNLKIESLIAQKFAGNAKKMNLTYSEYLKQMMDVGDMQDIFTDPNVGNQFQAIIKTAGKLIEYKNGNGFKI